MSYQLQRGLRLVLLCATLVCACQAQVTSVSFQVTDTDGQTWNKGTWTVQLSVPAGQQQPAQFLILGTTTPVPNQTQTGLLNTSGAGSATLTPNASIAPGNTQWTFNFCPLATPAACLQQSYVISGTSQTLTPVPPGIRISVLSPVIRATAYLDLEITGATYGSLYFNLTDATLHLCSVVSGGACTWTIGQGGVTGATLNGGLVLSGNTLGLRTDCLATQSMVWDGAIWNCGTGGGGGGGITGLTAGVVPQASSPTAIINSSPQLDNGLTTPNTLTYPGSGGVNLPSDGVHAGSVQVGGNTTLPTNLAANAFGFIGPAAASFTSYFFQPNATPPTAGQSLIAGTPTTCNGLTCIPLNYSNAAGGGNPILENCAPDQTGNSFFNVTSLTNYFYGAWAFIFNTVTYINCTVFVPAAQAGATIVLDIVANDATAGHTANFQTCDIVINSGTVNIGALTCAANQTFTTTSTAYNRVTLTFNVQSTLANNSILVVKIATSTTGTPPTANMLVYPHFIL